MKEQGYRLVNLWLDQTEAALLERQAEKAGKKLATYLRERCYLLARDEIGHQGEK